MLGVLLLFTHIFAFVGNIINKDIEFFNGKIASAKFFVRSVLPHISVERAVVESETGEIMNIAESAF